MQSAGQRAFFMLSFFMLPLFMFPIEGLARAVALASASEKGGISDKNRLFSFEEPFLRRPFVRGWRTQTKRRKHD